MGGPAGWWPATDVGEPAVAESPEVAHDPGWYVDELGSTLVVAPDHTRLQERWTVVAEVPLDELLLDLDLDGPNRRLRPVGRGCPTGAEAVVDAQGAEVTPDSWPASASGRQIVDVRLPRPLWPGERHAFDLAVVAPPWPGPARHVVVPPVPCRRLDLRVRFGRPDAAPAAVTLVAGWAAAPAVPRAALGAALGAAAGERIPVDRAGDVAVAFSDLRPGLAYGVAW
jgi:hypothetical protein